MTTIAETMRQILPADRVHDHPALVATYAVDASYYEPRALLVVDVHNLKEVRAVLENCAANKLGVTFRGAGTAVSGQACGEGVLVRLMGPEWKRLEVLDQGKLLWAGSGVIGIEVNEALAPFQRKMGAAPASITSATMGGIIADNSAGMCCMVEENCYHAIQGMRLMLADGTSLDTTDRKSVADFRQSHADLLDTLSSLRAQVTADNDVVARIKRKYAIKNTIGYTVNSFVDHEDPIDILVHLMVGSEGTLGFIHEVLMETIPSPPLRAVGLLFFPSMHVATDLVVALKDRCSIDAAESCTTGRAGGLNCEPLKAVENLEPPKGGYLFKQIELIHSFVFFFLVLDICPYSLFILTNCRYVITSCPKILPNKILLSTLKVTGNLNCAFSFDKAHYLGHRVFGWNRKQDMDMIWHQIPFDHCAFFLSGQFSKYFTQIFPQVSEDRFLTVLRYPDDVILAIPLGVA